MSKAELEGWLRKTREHVYAQRDSQELNDPSDSYNHVSNEQPDFYRFDVAWIYEIDFDNLVFHANNQPLFRLDNMPPDNYISDTHFIRPFRLSCIVRAHTRPISLRLACTTSNPDCRG
jgi:hypothetical protein